MVSFGDEEHLLLSQDVTGAAQVEAMRRDFVANVSHELRTPLTVLAGFLETIQDLKLDAARVRDYVGLMAPQAERMKRLIDDLLTLSALEHAPPPPDAERVPLRPLLQRVRAEAEALSAGKHRISLEIAGAHDLLGAEREIASAFTNLATNAVRYTPAGGEIRLRWRFGRHGAASSRSRTAASGSTRSTCRASPSVSTASTAAARARPAAPASACRSSSTRSRATRPRSPSKARPARAAASAPAFLRTASPPPR